MDRKEEIKKVLEIIGLEEDPEKYIDSIEYILNLFNKIDEYYEYAEGLEPLFHPMDLELEPNSDEIGEQIEMEHLKRDEDGYVRGPPLKRR